MVMLLATTLLATTLLATKLLVACKKAPGTRLLVDASDLLLLKNMPGARAVN